MSHRLTITLNDFLKSVHSLRRMKSLQWIWGWIPGLRNLKTALSRSEDQQFNRIEAIVRSMTPIERSNSKIIGRSRCKRIARGSGTTTREVVDLVCQFEAMSEFMSENGL
jgi:signal recognition particle subunit SRP54